MIKQNPKSGVIETSPGYLEEIMTSSRPHDEKNLKLLLIPYLSFRLYVKFQKQHPGNYPNPTRTFYSNEFRVTYKQCLFGKVPDIKLFKQAGYQALIDYVENGIKGKYLSAKIYMRDAETGAFDTLCREYYKGGLEKQNDPLLSEDEVQILYYSVKNGKLVIEKTNPNEIDFKSEVNNQLNI